MAAKMKTPPQIALQSLGRRASALRVVDCIRNEVSGITHASFAEHIHSISSDTGVSLYDSYLQWESIIAGMGNHLTATYRS